MKVTRDGDPQRDQRFEEKGRPPRETRDRGKVELSEKDREGSRVTPSTETSYHGWAREQLLGGKEQQSGKFGGFAD